MFFVHSHFLYVFRAFSFFVCFYHICMEKFFQHGSMFTNRRVLVT